MTILAIDEFGVSSPGRDARTLAFAAESAANELSDRTVFCAIHMEWTDELGISEALLDVEPGAEATAAVQGWVADHVRTGDVVVLDAPPTSALCGALRDRGAHAVRRVDVRPAARPLPPGGSGGGELGVDAYVTAWRAPGPRGLAVEHLLALMPAADRVSDKSMTVGPREHARGRQRAVAWSSLLADVVRADRGEHVGGVRRSRPAVAAR